MAKKRTRAQKEKAHHNFTISWDPSLKIQSPKANVKRHFKNEASSKSIQAAKTIKANITEHSYDNKAIRKDIIKSLSLASLILCLELVIYLVWKN